MREMTLSEVFSMLHGAEASVSVLAWDGDTGFACNEDLSDSNYGNWESIKISDLEKNTDDADDILFRFHRSSCDNLQSLLNSLFSCKAVQGFCIWHEDGSGHSFGITRNSETESENWNHRPNGWTQWVGYGRQPESWYLGRCRPNEKK